VVNTVPHVVVKADDYAILIEDSSIVVTKGKECESFLVLIIILVDAGYA
jgi:hypothetical protein